MDEFEFGRLAYLMILLAAVGGWVMVEYRGRMGFALRSALAWGLIFLGVLAGYGLWSDIRQTVMPAQTLRADALILDLEDAVAPPEKMAARALVAEAPALALATPDGRPARPGHGGDAQGHRLA